MPDIDYFNQYIAPGYGERGPSTFSFGNWDTGLTGSDMIGLMAMGVGGVAAGAAGGGTAAGTELAGAEAFDPSFYDMSSNTGIGSGFEGSFAGNEAFDYSGFNGYEPGGLAGNPIDVDYGQFSGYEPGGTAGNPSTPGPQTPRSIFEEMMRRRGRFPLIDIASGIYGMSQANRTERASRDADPMSGYRSQYAQQLSHLAANPNTITTMPGYAAGQQAVERRLASQGYLGSGNMMQAMSNYGGDFYNREVARLSQLATPSPGAIESRVAGQNAASNQRGRSLASIGYGLWNLF